jgi:3',5'-cyclic AMP phosphodiesterase CpdA
MTFLLAHLSDPHVPPLPIARLRELAGKRMLGYLNWTRNRHGRHSLPVLDALTADMLAQHPDHIAVTGDLVNLSLASEYEPAHRWIESVGPPDRVTVIPGNHDAYVPGAAARFDRVFADYIAGDETGAAAYPFVRRRGDIVLVAVSSGVATAPMQATGWLGAEQRAALDETLAGLAGTDLFRILLIHHPLRSFVRHKRLTDAAKVREILERRGVDLVLHGHDHVHATIFVDGPDGRSIPVVGVPSASATTGHKRPAAAYNLFAIRRDGESWQCAMTTRGYDPTGTLKELAKVQLI